MSKIKETKTETKAESQKTENHQNFNYLPIINGAIGAVVGIALVLFFSAGMPAASPAEDSAAGEKSLEEVSGEVVSYVNKNFEAQGAAGIVAELKSNEEVSNLYKICLDVKQEGELAGTECVFATKDGKKALIEVFDLGAPIAAPPETGDTEDSSSGSESPVVKTCEDAEKVEKPTLDAYVVSYCPFGIQTMNGLSSAAELLAEESDITVRYISTVNQDGTVSAMHGADELLENRRQICLREEQEDKYWDYIKCFVETGETETCEESTDIDSEALSTCVADNSTEYLIADAYLDGDDRTGLGSPTFYLNGVKLDEPSFDSYNRSPEGMKNRICCGMIAPADDCSEELLTASPPRGFGVIGDAEASGGGSC